MKIISNAELLSLWKRGSGNGALQRMPSLKRGLFSAALEHTRTFCTIVNQKLIGMIIALVERIDSSLDRMIFLYGLDSALGFMRNTKVVRMFSTVRKWIKGGSYIFWFGTDMFSRRTWILATKNKS